MTRSLTKSFFSSNPDSANLIFSEMGLGNWVGGMVDTDPTFPPENVASQMAGNYDIVQISRHRQHTAPAHSRPDSPNRDGEEA